MALSRGSRLFMVALVLLAAAFFGGLFAFNAASGSAGEDGEPVTVTIPEGMGASEVADVLAQEGVIDSPWIFRLLARFDDRASRIKPGTYELTTGMSTGDILAQLAAGPPLADTWTVTIPEGLTVDAIVERIAGAEGSPFTVDELREALVGVPLPEWVPLGELPEGAPYYEGMLFPATYEFFADSNAQEVLATLVAETDEALSAVTPPEGFTRYELLIIASLIEREVRVPEERPIVASVIYNRLAAPMRLQIDATVQYAQGEHSERLLYEDLRIDSAWNTYEVDGLPPTPIAAPGRAAIEAAANPGDTSFLFYVVCDTATGEHAFAETNEEHQRNVARFREIRDEGGSFCDET